MDVKLLIQSTPNPNALKFVVNMPLKTEGNASFKNAEDAKEVPLAEALFSVANVVEIYLFDNYVTVTQDGNADWDDIEEQVRQIIIDQMPSHNPDFIFEEKGPERPQPANDIPELAQIEEILDRTIRPYLQMDGGDLSILDYKNDVLMISYQGACGSCPSAAMGTLQAIENILKDEFNPAISVENVGGGF